MTALAHEIPHRHAIFFADCAEVFVAHHPAPRRKVGTHRRLTRAHLQNATGRNLKHVLTDEQHEPRSAVEVPALEHAIRLQLLEIVRHVLLLRWTVR